MMKSLLRLDGVSHFFGSRLIFKGVSCELAPASIMLVAGPNGAGKSTLIKIMAGLLHAHSGTVERTVSDAATAYMGHQTFVYPTLSALGNLQFWNDIYERGLDDSALFNLLDRVGLKGFALEAAGTFSRGMAQRLSLARILLIEPQLVFLDEPATGLDTASQSLLYRELAQARERGAGIVWISHDLERDVRKADTILQLSARSMAFFGPASGFSPEGA
jgi:heme exporter protein A